MATRLLIEGRVQGVGFREWLRGEATRHGVTGWCRNLPDGRVEAVLAGDQAAVARVTDACRIGPRAAEVTGIATSDAPEPDVPGFSVRR